jgi:hypothetical protein
MHGHGSGFVDAAFSSPSPEAATDNALIGLWFVIDTYRRPLKSMSIVRSS